MKGIKTAASPSWARKMVAAVAATWIAVSLVAGCAQTPAAGAGADCSHFFYSADSTVNPDQPHSGPFKLVVILLDLSSNSPQMAASIDEGIHPYLQAAVNSGAFVKVDVDAGSGTQIQSPGCFDGTQPFLVTRANQIAQQKSQAAAVNALDSTLKSFIGSVKVSPRGSASRLLHEAPEQVSGLRDSAPYPVDAVRVILWSNLLGYTGTSDCLNVNGVPGTPAYASAIAKRCFSEHQLAPLPGASIDILGVGAGAVNDQQSLLADDLAAALCTEYGGNCQASPA
jgi:hypothetical protein